MKLFIYIICISVSFNAINVIAQDAKLDLLIGVGGSRFDRGQDIACDSNGDYYVTGFIQEGVTFQDSEIIPNGDTDIFIAKYNSKGKCQWHKAFGGALISPYVANEMGVSLILDEDQNLYVTGYFNDVIDLDGTRLLSKGDDDIFLIKFSTDGVLIWAKQFGGELQDIPKKLLLGKCGDLHLLGIFNSNIQLGDKNIVGSGIDSFIAVIDKATGNVKHAFNLNQKSIFRAEDFDIDNERNIIISGHHEQFYHKENNASDLFISKHTKSGKLIWQQKVFGTGLNSVNTIFSNSNNDIYIAGGFRNSLEIENITVAAGIGKDAYLISLDKNGDLKWVNSYGGHGDKEFLDIIEIDNRIHLVGKLHRNIGLLNKNEFIAEDNKLYFITQFNLLGSLHNISSLPLKSELLDLSKFNTNKAQILFTGSYHEDIISSAVHLEKIGFGDLIFGAIEIPFAKSDQTNGNNLHIFPNPVKNSFEVIDYSDKYDWASLEIIDASGRLVYSFQPPFNKSLSYDISHLNTGAYFVVFNKSNTSSITISIIKD